MLDSESFVRLGAYLACQRHKILQYVGAELGNIFLAVAVALHLLVPERRKSVVTQLAPHSGAHLNELVVNFVQLVFVIFDSLTELHISGAANTAVGVRKVLAYAA